MGHLKMKEAMWKVDSEGTFRFSDQTDPFQEVLFRNDHDRELFAHLQKSFKGQSVDVTNIRKFVHDQTAYIDKHLNGSLKYGESASLIKVNETKKDGKKRRQNTFPDGSMITFS